VTEPERRAAELRTLLARLAHQQEVLERIRARLERAESRAAPDEDEAAIAAVALFLQHYYTAVEDSLLRIVEELDGTVPTSDDWHRLLLEQLALDIPEVRPALLGPELGRHLDVLRRFRHRVRHAYDEDYEWRRMAEPLQARKQVTKLLRDFFAHTETVIREIIGALDDAAG
jgi:hypothetical protein